MSGLPGDGASASLLTFLWLTNFVCFDFNDSMPLVIVIIINAYACVMFLHSMKLRMMLCANVCIKSIYHIFFTSLA